MVSIETREEDLAKDKIVRLPPPGADFGFSVVNEARQVNGKPPLTWDEYVANNFDKPTPQQRES